MNVLILGASGATGKKLVEQLLEMEHHIKVIVRPTSNIPDNWRSNDNITVVEALIGELTENELADHIADCHAIVSCLGHNLTWKGIYGKPRKLVLNAVTATCKAIRSNAPERPVKFLLMNTAGNRNRDLNEPISLGQRMVIGLLRVLLPPHPDNEQAADHLRLNVGQNAPFIEWVAVRPDNLTDEEEVTAYELYPSPIRSALFDPGKTSRVNVAHFMAKLIEDQALWEQWKGQMPVIYNKEKTKPAGKN